MPINGYLVILSSHSQVSAQGYCPCVLCSAVTLADSQADGRWPSANDRVKRTERGCARAADQVFRTRELMSSGPVAESESRVERTFSTFSGAKDTDSKSRSVRHIPNVWPACDFIKVWREGRGHSLPVWKIRDACVKDEDRCLAWRNSGGKVISPHYYMRSQHVRPSASAGWKTNIKQPYHKSVWTSNTLGDRGEIAAQVAPCSPNDTCLCLYFNL